MECEFRLDLYLSLKLSNHSNGEYNHGKVQSRIDGFLRNQKGIAIDAMTKLRSVDIPPLGHRYTQEQKEEKEFDEPRYVDNCICIDPFDESCITPETSVIQDEEAASREELIDVVERRRDACQLFGLA